VYRFAPAFIGGPMAATAGCWRWAYICTVKTAPEATAVQIVWSSRRGLRHFELLG
jgi:hypothetical protein